MQFGDVGNIRSEGYRTLDEGQPVIFEAEQRPKGIHAVEVEIKN